MVQRLLLLDGTQGKQLENVQVIHDIKDIRRLYELYYYLEAPVNLTLDTRGVSSNHLNYLLKFLEEYEGGIALVANDPPPPPILSRFAFKEKEVNIDTELDFREVYFGRISKKLKEKVKELLDITRLDATEVDYDQDDEEVFDYEV